MSKILCIPDIHGRNFWRNVVFNNANKVDKVIFLGDYLDPYPNEIEKTPELMDMKSFDDSSNAISILNDICSLKKNNPDKYILLTGNHTDSYIWSEFASATRTDNRNWEKYHNIFLENLSLFNLVWIENDTIFSHAGITKEWAKALAVELSLTIDLNAPVKSAAKYLSRINLNNILDKKLIGLLGDISHYRGGYSYYGSCEWADLMEHIDHYQSEVQEKIVPINSDSEIYQVFGHTQLQKPLITDKWACLDCRQGFIVDTITHEITACEI